MTGVQTCALPISQANTSQLFGFSGDEQEYSLTELLNGRLYPVENTVEDILLDSEKDIRAVSYTHLNSS